MPIKAKYVHTNLIAQDWEKLVEFYINVFGCTPATPESNLSGQWVETITGVPKAEIRVIHLLLPGYGDGGPTLEVIRYNQQEDRPTTAANRPGFAHLAFMVDDVETAQEAVIAGGGGVVGERISVDIPERGRLTAVYVTDPEGNILELLNWTK